MLARGGEGVGFVYFLPVCNLLYSLIHVPHLSTLRSDAVGIIFNYSSPYDTNQTDQTSSNASTKRTGVSKNPQTRLISMH